MKLKTKLTLIAGILASSVTLNANAGIITNQTELLSGDNHEQLALWMGNDFDLTRIFAKGIDGNTSEEWHDLVDKQGATITVMEVFNGDDRMIIGGYNKYNWNIDNPTLTSTNKDNFLFNLSTGIQYQKNDNTNDLVHSFDHYGIRFGVGDISVNSTLSSGTTNIGHSYGDREYWRDEEYINEFTGSFNSWVIGSYETYLISDPTGAFGTGAIPSNLVEVNGASGEQSGVSDVPFEHSVAAFGLLALFCTRKKKQP